MEKDINEFGTGLLSLGYKDKRVAVIGKNSYEWALTYYAVLNGLGVLVPLDKGLPEAEIELSLKRSKAEVIVFEKEYEEVINRIIDRKKAIAKAFEIADKDSVVLILGKGRDNYMAIEDSLYASVQYWPKAPMRKRSRAVSVLSVTYRVKLFSFS